MTARGRPPYEPSDKDRRIVEMMAGWAIPENRIANVLAIDPKTLRKHYRTELDVGHSKLEAQLAQNLLRIATGHDRQALIATIFALKSGFGWVETQPPAKDPPLGKKEAAVLAAKTAGEDSEWGDDLRPPSAARFRPRPPPKGYRMMNWGSATGIIG